MGEAKQAGELQALAPRGLGRIQAAVYVGVGATKFDELVEQELMPKPKQIGKRLVWDRFALDAAFEALPDREDPNPWDR